MQHVLTLFLCLFLPLAVFSQTDEPPVLNKWVLGGNLSFVSLKTDNETNRSSFGISLRPAKQLNNKVIIGTSLNYSAFRTGDPNTRTNRFSIGLFSRHSFNPENKLQFYLSPYYSFGLIIDRSAARDRSSHVFQLSSGLSYDINNKWRLTTNLGGLSYTILPQRSRTLQFGLFRSTPSLGVEFKI